MHTNFFNNKIGDWQDLNLRLLESQPNTLTITELQTPYILLSSKQDIPVKYFILNLSL